MRLPSVFILISILLTVRIAFAEPIRPLGFPIDEVGKAEFKVIGAEKKKNKSIVKLEKLPVMEKQTTRVITRDGKDYYEIKEEMRLFNEQHVQTTSLIEIAEALKPISYTLLRKSPEGEVIERWEVRLDAPSWNYPEDTYFTPAISLAFRSLIFHDVEETSLHLWQNDLTVVRMTLKVVGKDRIRIPPGEFPCFKIKMEPDVKSVIPVGNILATLLQPFMPELYFWVSEKEPHPVLRAEGSFGPPGSPRMVMEAVEGWPG
jgi:hypothetical protein